MSVANRDLRQRDELAQWPRMLVIATRLAVFVGFLAACERSEADSTLDSSSAPISKELVWSYLVSDSGQDAQIRKWSKPELRGLIIVDPARDAFYQQFAPLLRQVGEQIGVKIHVCEAIIESESIVSPPEPNCGKPSYDFYLVATNGRWTESEWKKAGSALLGQASEMLVIVREQLATMSGKTCRSMVRQSVEVPGQIEHAVAVIDSDQSLVFGMCGINVFLYMLGANSFDGDQPLDPKREAENLALFLVKRTPYGGSYLLQRLYSPAVKPGMRKDEFLRTLP